MKKIFLFALAMVMLLSCVACSDANATPATTVATTIQSTTTAEPTTVATTTAEPTTPAATTTEVTTTPATTTEVTEPTERVKPEIQVVTIDEYMTEKYGSYEFVRSESWFEMYRVNGVSVFVFKQEELEHGINLEDVYDYMFTYNWADNGYYQMNADQIEEYYDELMKPYLENIGTYALFSYLEQAVMPSGLSYTMPYEEALKEYGDFLFPQIAILVEKPLNHATKKAIIDQLTAAGIKVHLHIGTAPAEDRELHRNSVIPFFAEKYSNQLEVRINWNGDMPS